MRSCSRRLILRVVQTRSIPKIRRPPSAVKRRTLTLVQANQQSSPHRWESAHVYQKNSCRYSIKNSINKIQPSNYCRICRRNNPKSIPVPQPQDVTSGRRFMFQRQKRMRLLLQWRTVHTHLDEAAAMRLHALQEIIEIFFL